MYGAPVSGAAQLEAVSQHILSTSLRSCALRKACCYSTVGTPAAHVLGKTIPAGLLAGERAAIAKTLSDIPRPYPRRFVQVTKSAARVETIRKWQEEWSRSSCWTRTLLPEIEPWLSCGADTTFYSTMALSGHGSFGSYLQRIGKRGTASCSDCGAEDTPNHALFLCPTTETLRQQLLDSLHALDSTSPVEWSAASFAVTAFRSANHSTVVMQHLDTVMRRRFNAEHVMAANGTASRNTTDHYGSDTPYVGVRPMGQGRRPDG